MLPPRSALPQLHDAHSLTIITSLLSRFGERPVQWPEAADEEAAEGMQTIDINVVNQNGKSALYMAAAAGKYVLPCARACLPSETGSALVLAHRPATHPPTNTRESQVRLSTHAHGVWSRPPHCFQAQQDTLVCSCGGRQSRWVGAL